MQLSVRLNRPCIPFLTVFLFIGERGIEYEIAGNED